MGSVREESDSSETVIGCTDVVVAVVESMVVVAVPFVISTTVFGFSVPSLGLDSGCNIALRCVLVGDIGARF